MVKEKHFRKRTLFSILVGLIFTSIFASLLSVFQHIAGVMGMFFLSPLLGTLIGVLILESYYNSKVIVSAIFLSVIAGSLLSLIFLAVFDSVIKNSYLLSVLDFLVSVPAMNLIYFSISRQEGANSPEE